MADALLDVLKGNHLRFGVERILVFAVIDLRRSFGENQNGLVALQKRHGFRNHAGLNAKRLRRLSDGCGGGGKLDDVIEQAAGSQIGFCFFKRHGKDFFLYGFYIHLRMAHRSIIRRMANCSKVEK